LPKNDFLKDDSAIEAGLFNRLLADDDKPETVK